MSAKKWEPTPPEHQIECTSPVGWPYVGDRRKWYDRKHEDPDGARVDLDAALLDYKIRKEARTAARADKRAV